MADNPQPSHITPEMWWFIEAWERLEPETVFAGAWGDFKPGYHCDYHTLKHTSGWQNDYSVQLADDQVGGGHQNEAMGAGIDITFPSAQNGNYANIRKYSDRVRAAWKARDPRLKGWREVLCNCSDGDSSADGLDFVNWSERTPDDSHKWHMHFSCLRKYLHVLEVFEAMLSILRGETLAQWLAKGDDMSVNTFWLDPAIHGEGEDGYWISVGGKRERINDNDDYAKARLAHPGLIALPEADHNGWPTTKLTWSIDEVNRILGRKYVAPSGGDGHGVTMDQVNAAISGTHLVPPTA